MVDRVGLLLVLALVHEHQLVVHGPRQLGLDGNMDILGLLRSVSLSLVLHLLISFLFLLLKLQLDLEVPRRKLIVILLTRSLSLGLGYLTAGRFP